VIVGGGLAQHALAGESVSVHAHFGRALSSRDVSARRKVF
jgi:hypothetical protein